MRMCNGKSSIKIPDGVEEIKQNVLAWNYESKISKIEIPASVKKIDVAAFNENNFTSIILDSNNAYYKVVNSCVVSSDGSELVAICGGSTQKLVIPDGVKKLYSQTLHNLRAKSISISSSVESIENDCFENNSLTAFEVDENNEYFCAIDGILYSKDKTKIIRFPEEKSMTSLVIPSGVTTICGQCFRGCRSIKKIYIPDTVCNIERYPFNRCNATVYFAANEPGENWAKNWQANSSEITFVWGASW